MTNNPNINSSFGSEYREIQAILKQVCDKLSVRDVCYCYDISPNSRFGDMFDKHVTIKRFHERERLYASSNEAYWFWKAKMGLLLYNSKDFVKTIAKTPVLRWDDLVMPKRVERLCTSCAIENMLTISIKCSIFNGLCGRFTIILDEKGKADQLQKEVEMIHAYLTQVQQEIIIKYSNIINPLIDYNILTTVSSGVLELVAKGFAREDISKKLFISHRGVDYHVNALKQVFGAKSLANLVYLATQSGVIR